MIWKAQSTHSNKECNCHSSDHFISPPLATHSVAQTEKEDSLAILVKLMKLSEVRYVSPFDVALVHIGIGETDAAFEWLEKSLHAARHENAFSSRSPVRFGENRSSFH